jgi:hypothetical protein
MVSPFNPESVVLILSPHWFFGIDTFFDVFSVLTTLLISFYSYRMYKFSRKINYKWFSVSLLLISLGFISKILTSILMQFPPLLSITFGSFVVIYRIATQSNILFILGQLSYRFLVLVGFFGVYWLISKSKEKNKIPLILFLLFATTILSGYAYPAFSMAMVILLSHIVYYYSVNYKKNKNIKTALILCSFALLLLSQILFIFLFLDIRVYVASEIVQLAGYLLLLYSYYLLVKK